MSDQYCRQSEWMPSGQGSGRLEEFSVYAIRPLRPGKVASAAGARARRARTARKSERTMRRTRAPLKSCVAKEGLVRREVKRMMGFEPTTFAMARRRSSQLSYIREEPRV